MTMSSICGATGPVNCSGSDWLAKASMPGVGDLKELDAALRAPLAVATASFFARPAARVARALLGKALIRRQDTSQAAYIVTETEAHEGARSGQPFGACKDNAYGGDGWSCGIPLYPSHLWPALLNIVTGEIDEAAAVLIGGLDQVNGPGRGAAALRIDASFNGRKATRTSGLWIEDIGCQPVRSRIRRTARIGVGYAGPIWATKRQRFVLDDIGRPGGLGLGLQSAPPDFVAVANSSRQCRCSGQLLPRFALA